MKKEHRNLIVSVLSSFGIFFISFIVFSFFYLFLYFLFPWPSSLLLILVTYLAVYYLFNRKISLMKRIDSKSFISLTLPMIFLILAVYI